MKCSVIISSSNRAAALEKTLRAFSEVLVPATWEVEMIVVDNASKDHTAEVAQGVRLKNFTVRYLYESRVGKSNALNTGIAAAQGEALLFTDDDVIPAKDWLEKIATPILNGDYAGVMGKIVLAEDLSRPWLKRDHEVALAAFDATTGPVTELIGANMGLHRSVFQYVPSLDSELGPGATGFGEETLLSWQINQAGLKLGLAPDAVVVHYPDVSRLLRSHWLDGARKRGRSLAYILHHWQHGEMKLPLIRYYYLSAKLLFRRRLQPPTALDEEGCPPWEMSYVAEMEMCHHFLQERKRPRNYTRHGLIKLLRPEL